MKKHIKISFDMDDVSRIDQNNYYTACQYFSMQDAVPAGIAPEPQAVEPDVTTVETQQVWPAGVGPDCGASCADMRTIILWCRGAAIYTPFYICGLLYILYIWMFM